MGGVRSFWESFWANIRALRRPGTRCVCVCCVRMLPSLPVVLLVSSGCLQRTHAAVIASCTPCFIRVLATHSCCRHCQLYSLFHQGACNALMGLPKLHGATSRWSSLKGRGPPYVAYPQTYVDVYCIAPSKQVRLATKLAAYPWRLAPSQWVGACKASLKRTRQDKIALAQLHWSTSNYAPLQVCTWLVRSGQHGLFMHVRVALVLDHTDRGAFAYLKSWPACAHACMRPCHYYRCSTRCWALHLCRSG
jgi:hypothetical protein